MQEQLLHPKVFFGADLVEVGSYLLSIFISSRCAYLLLTVQVRLVTNQILKYLCLVTYVSITLKLANPLLRLLKTHLMRHIIHYYSGICVLKVHLSQ